MHRTPRSSLALLLPLLLVAGLVLGACSSDDDASGSEKTTTTEKASGDRATEIGRQVINSDAMDTVTPKMQSCVGRKFISEFGSKAESIAKTADKESSKLTKAQLQVVSDSFDECIPGKDFADYLLTEVYKQADIGTPDAASITCTATAIDGKVGQVVMASGGGTDAASVAAAIDPCVPKAQLTGILAGSLKQQQSTKKWTDGQVTCIADAMAAQATFSDLLTQNTTKLQGLVTSAEAACPA